MNASGQSVRLAAPAKINLFLEVLGRRADGFHELRTVLQTIDLCDELSITLRPRRREALPGEPDIALELLGLSAGAGTNAETAAETGTAVPSDGRNLAVRAAQLLLAACGAAGEVGVQLHLTKRIPAGGGLGGGSSDAAAVLLGLHALLGEPLGALGPDSGGRHDPSTSQLHALAAQLGSDVPFFLTGGTALCTGRGERVQPLDSVPAGEFTLVMLPFGVATAAVYAALAADLAQRAPATADPAAQGAAEAALAARFRRARPEQLSSLFRNDLESAARRVEPRLNAWLSRAGLHLSGSGSTVFGFGAPMEGELPSGGRVVAARTFSSGRNS
ncbi:MAG: 4-(cytidine 5'-diphospho)-2-C-methyl-D-erythritol kinase [Planctomycetota bacterium]